MAKAERSTVNELLSEYDNLWWQFDLNGAESVLDAILSENPRQPEALRHKAFVQYYYHQDYAGALGAIQKAIEAESLEAKNYSIQGDIFFARGDPEQAIGSYSRAIELDSTRAEYHLALAKSLLRRDDKNGAKKGLEAALQLNPYLLEANNLLHMAYVESGEYSKAYRIWKTQFFFDESGTSAYCLGEWNVLYQTAISQNSREPEFHRTMGQLYERLLLYDEAKIEFDRAKGQSPEDESAWKSWERISKFIHFRDELKETAIAFYQQQALKGKMKEKNLLARLMPVYAEMAGVFPDAEKIKCKNKAGLLAVNGLIDGNFHVMIIFGYTNGFSDCHFGHVMVDTPKELSQWGKTGKLQMVVLKNMVTNGFSAWYWNYRAQDGGWTTSGDKAQANKFVEVHDSKYSAAWHRWETVADTMKRGETLAEDEEREPGFGDRPALDVFFSSRLDHLLRYKAMDGSIAPYRDKGPGEQRDAFTRLMFDHYSRTSTVIHEGQHALDAMYGHFPQWELEFRAKLSEIYYGGMPHLSLSDILTRDIGNKKLSHGRAATLLFEEYSKHIMKNGSKYHGIDTKKNIMMQLHKLSAQELKEIAREIYYQHYKS